MVCRAQGVIEAINVGYAYYFFDIWEDKVFFHPFDVCCCVQVFWFWLWLWLCCCLSDVVMNNNVMLGFILQYSVLQDLEMHFFNKKKVGIQILISYWNVFVPLKNAGIFFFRALDGCEIGTSTSMWMLLFPILVLDSYLKFS